MAAKWSDDQYRAARAAALKGARGDEDVADAAILRMVKHGAAPEGAFGYGRNLLRERLKTSKRREARAPTAAYDPDVHDRGEPEAPEQEEEEDRRPHVTLRPPDYAAQFASAARNARYIADVLSQTTAPMLEDIARALAEHPDAPPSTPMIGTLANFARLQRAFSGAAPIAPTAPQIALSIKEALRIARPKDSDTATWILHCIAIDFPGAPLRNDAATRDMLAGLKRSSTDRQIAAAAGVLVGQQTTAAAMKTARARTKQRR